MVAAANSMRLGRLLVGSGLINDAQLAEAVAAADGRPLPHVLDELGFADEGDHRQGGRRVDGVALHRHRRL